MTVCPKCKAHVQCPIPHHLVHHRPLLPLNFLVIYLPSPHPPSLVNPSLCPLELLLLYPSLFKGTPFSLYGWKPGSPSSLLLCCPCSPQTPPTSGFQGIADGLLAFLSIFTSRPILPHPVIKKSLFFEDGPMGYMTFSPSSGLSSPELKT